MAGGTTTAAKSLNEAHAALRADTSVQFFMRRVEPPPPPPKPPAWADDLGKFLERLFAPIGRFLDWLFSFLPAGPWGKVLLWGVLIALGAGLLWMIALRLREGEWRLPRRRRAVQIESEPEEDWTPQAAPARALLAQADALAADGRFAEAVHLLLLRGVEDIGRRRPDLVRPALTSRDLAVADAIPAAPRTLFAGIARIVERSLFGGRPVGATEWGEARAAYADFALPRAWAGAR